MLFFFFKQKTAYEMRISDWSSDVCSSDLAAARGRRGHPCIRRAFPVPRPGPLRGAGWQLRVGSRNLILRKGHARIRRAPFLRAAWCGADPRQDSRHGEGESPPGTIRSEEHTSELQSLMRISYAVFCLKKNKH